MAVLAACGARDEEPAVDPQAAPAAAPRDIRARVVILGDSLSAGFGLDPEQAFPALLQARINAADLPFQVINAGVSGDTTSSGPQRLAWHLKVKIDVLVLALGGNDGLRGIDPAVVERNLRAMIALLAERSPGAAVVIAGMEAPPNMGADYRDRFRAVFPRVAEATGAALIPFLLEGVAGDPRLNQADGIHPTAQGQRRLADTVWRVLEPILRDHR